MLNCNRCCREAPAEGQSTASMPRVGVLKMGDKCPRLVSEKYTKRKIPCTGTLVEEDRPRCLQSVSDGGRCPGLHVCGRPARASHAAEEKMGHVWTFHGFVEPGTLVHYCGTHDPEARKARRAKRGPTQFERKCIARAKRVKWVEGMQAALALLSTNEHCSCGAKFMAETHNEACTITVAARALKGET